MTSRTRATVRARSGCARRQARVGRSRRGTRVVSGDTLVVRGERGYYFDMANIYSTAKRVLPIVAALVFVGSIPLASATGEEATAHVNQPLEEGAALVEAPVELTEREIAHQVQLRSELGLPSTAQLVQDIAARPADFGAVTGMRTSGLIVAENEMEVFIAERKPRLPLARFRRR